MLTPDVDATDAALRIKQSPSSSEEAGTSVNGRVWRILFSTAQRYSICKHVKVHFISLYEVIKKHRYFNR